MSDSLGTHRLQHTTLPCPSIVCRSLLKLKSTEYVMPSNHLILCHPLLLLPSIYPSIRVFYSTRQYIYYSTAHIIFCEVNDIRHLSVPQIPHV